MKDILNEIKKIKSTDNELVKFGKSVGFVFMLLYLLFKGKPSGYYFLYAGGFLVISAYIAPRLLKYIYIVWMTLGIVLGWFSTRIILSALYYLILTPTGLVMRLIGKDLLDLKRDKNSTSYWNYREVKPYAKTDTERQF